jgi:hypothetical protein
MLEIVVAWCSSPQGAMKGFLMKRVGQAKLCTSWVNLSSVELGVRDEDEVGGHAGFWGVSRGDWGGRSHSRDSLEGVRVLRDGWGLLVIDWFSQGHYKPLFAIHIAYCEARFVVVFMVHFCWVMGPVSIPLTWHSWGSLLVVEMEFLVLRMVRGG